jgi:lactoylglutathione lyase
MPTVSRLLHTRYRVNDLAASVKFYTEALGLTVSRRHTSPRGAQLVFLTTPNSNEEIELCQMPPGTEPVKVQADLTHLAFEVQDLEKFAIRAAAQGYPLSDGPTVTGSGSLIAFIDAPEGYEIELIQRSAPHA